MAGNPFLAAGPGPEPEAASDSELGPEMDPGRCAGDPDGAGAGRGLWGLLRRLEKVFPLRPSLSLPGSLPSSIPPSLPPCLPLSLSAEEAEKIA